ncbi:hypothetical protein [Shinella zoogloeoides]|uniref:hypothetical protein n=1 Tax=Shinella zoogloeoides TaxID=352475 RepID=UPI0028A7E56B|nr:hypothetical protein [Shinella zoogloeoides]
MLADTPTTVLEAVNQIIATIGEPPVNSVEDNGVIDAVMALQALSAVNRAVQLRGWHWNTEENYPIAASYPEGELRLPKNTLRVDTSGADAGLDLVVRGQRLYDRKNHTFEIGKSVSVNIVLLLPFEELPEAARTYITIKAARRFTEGQIGSELLSNFTLRDEQMALFALEDAEGETADYNILNNSFIVEVAGR